MALSRPSHPFDVVGVDLVRPPDRLSTGFFAKMTNVRSYIGGTVQTRAGHTQLWAALADTPIHSIFRLNDATPFNGGTPAIRVVGAGTKTYTGPLTGPGALVDSGWSGSPLSALDLTPPDSPQPWLYVFDSAQQRKYNVNGISAAVGIAQPSIPPTATLQQPGLNTIDDFEAVGAWVAAGSVANSPTLETGASGRVNTTIAKILYDVGSSGSYALVAPTSVLGIGVGCLLTLGGAETVLVGEVKIAIAPTTIAAILYDAGSTGLCTIQPTASLSTGQLQTPNISDLGERFGYVTTTNTTVENTIGPPIDFPVNCMIEINHGGGSAEFVRVLSAAVGPDGIQSFRCVCANTHAAGEGLAGKAAIRAFLTTARVAGDTIKTAYLTNLLTKAGSTMTGGIQNPSLTANLAQIGTRPTSADDEIHISLRVDLLQNVTEVRVYLNVDALGGADSTAFTENYYMAVWPANAIVAAIQSTNSANVATLQASLVNAISQAQIDNALVGQGISDNVNAVVNGGSIVGGGAPAPNAPVFSPQPIPVDSTSNQLALGNNQWVELRMRITDLQRIGTDTTRTLANVSGVQVLVSASTLNNLNISYDALWVQGGFGADVGDLGAPYVYVARYRSQLTGVASNWSAPMFGGISPRRQAVALTYTPSADPQAQVVDYARFGGALNQWTYVGYGLNAGSCALSDVYADSEIAGGPEIVFDDFQPWPIEDLPRSGTCNVTGNAVRWVSGDKFNETWAPGAAIQINGKTYTVAQTPSGAGPAPSATFLLLNENAGMGTGVAFYVSSATITGQALARAFGPYDAGGSTGTFIFNLDGYGNLRWSKGNNPDVTSDKNKLVIGSASEPLQNGAVYDGRPFVFTTNDCYLVAFDPTNLNLFRAELTPCGRGLWAPWWFCVAPEGIVFGSSDGIYLTANGAPAVSLTDATLYPLFPHDGQPGVVVNGYNPPDLTQTSRLRLTWAGRYIIFDYLDTNGAPFMLLYDRVKQGWMFDQFVGLSAALVTHAYDPGSGAYGILGGGTDGRLYVEGGTTDNGVAIPSLVRTPSSNEGDSRSLKYYSDIMLDLSTGATPLGVLAGFDNFSVDFTLAVGLTQATRDLVGLSIQGGGGYQAKNLGLEFSWVGASVVTLYEWQPSLIADSLSMLKAAWQTKSTALGLQGYKHLRDGWIAYSSPVPVQLTVFIDGVPYSATPNPLPATNGVYLKQYVTFPAVKGLFYTFYLTAANGFECKIRDCEIHGRAWGSSGPYAILNPWMDQYAA